MKPADLPVAVPATGGKPIRSWLLDVMAGRITLAAVPAEWQPHVRHMMLLPVYRLADQVLRGRTLDDRRRYLAAVPESVRTLVEAEAIRLHSMRRR